MQNRQVRGIMEGDPAVPDLHIDGINKIKDMYTDYRNFLEKTIGEIKEAGLYKNERVIVSPRGSGDHSTRPVRRC